MDFNTIRTAIEVMGGLVGIGLGLIVFRRHIRRDVEKMAITPSPLRVKAVEVIVTEEELQKRLAPVQERLREHGGAIEELRRELQSNYNELMKSAAEGRSRLHRSMDDLGQRLAALEAVLKPLDGISERFSRDIGRLEGLIQRARKL